ncbi:hypothetical protein F5877DRAFT_27119, partial [Lentinula edodes]
TAAYAFTDYRAQGQTIPSMLVDIGKPPTCTLSFFNLYLLVEDDRLKRHSKQTARWWKRM